MSEQAPGRPPQSTSSGRGSGPQHPSSLDDSNQPESAHAERKQATALAYDPGTPAPRVVASGRGAVAERIVELAQAADVPVRSDPALARALATLDLGEEVPEAMYRAVAAALAWAYKLDDRLVRPPSAD